VRKALVIQTYHVYVRRNGRYVITILKSNKLLFQFVFKIKLKWSEEITGTMGKYICNIKIFRYFH